MSSRRYTLALALVTLPVTGWAQGASPFMPPAAAAPAAAPAGGPLEYGGFVTTAEGKLFRIVGDKGGRKTGVYLRLGDKDANLGVTLRGYNAANQSVTVEYQGQTLTLEERKSKIVSSGSPAAMMAPLPAMPSAPAAAPAAAPAVAPAVTQSVVVNPTAADEQRRLEAVAAEVARRRAMREQAQQQSQPGTAPGSVPSPAGPARQQP
jgi:hypothetical protein